MKLTSLIHTLIEVLGDIGDTDVAISTDDGSTLYSDAFLQVEPLANKKAALVIIEATNSHEEEEEDNEEQTDSDSETV